VLVPTAVIVKKWFADHSIQLLQNSIDEDSLKKTREGVIRTIASDEFAIIFSWWFEFWEKYI
jgi:hypothetical protein